MRENSQYFVKFLLFNLNNKIWDFDFSRPVLFTCMRTFLTLFLRSTVFNSFSWNVWIIEYFISILFNTKSIWNDFLYLFSKSKINRFVYPLTRTCNDGNFINHISVWTYNMKINFNNNNLIFLNFKFVLIISCFFMKLLNLSFISEIY